MCPCVNLLVWLVGFLVLDYVLHKLNPVRHEILHLWRESLACWIVLGKTLLCLILFLFLYWGCITHWIHSVSFLVLCTSRILHMVHMMMDCLAYWECIFLSLAGLTLYGSNKIIQICGGRMIGGEEFLIDGANLDWFFPAVVICPTIEGESLYLQWIFPLWSCFWRSVCLLVRSPWPHSVLIIEWWYYNPEQRLWGH